MTIDEIGRIEFLPETGNLGTNPVEIQVTDSFGDAATQNYDLTVSADSIPPQVVVNLSDNPVAIGDTVILTVQAVDNVAIAEISLTVDGEPIPLDSGGRGFFTPTATGTFDISALATDDAGNVGVDDTVALLTIDPTDNQAPMVEIITPTAGQDVSVPTDIRGSVTDDNLVEYRVLLQRIDNPVVTELFVGVDPVTDGVLAPFDTSLFQNGTYVVSVTALDGGGNITTQEVELNITGRLKLGNFQLQFVDLEIPLVGVPITIARIYDSLNRHDELDFGFGWQLALFNTRLSTNAVETGLEDALVFGGFQPGTRVFVTLPGGERHSFTFEPELTGAIFPSFRPKFVPDEGVTSTLTVEQFDLMFFGEFKEFRDFFGSLPYNPASPFFGGEYKLTTDDGFCYVINGQTGDLKFIEDRNGNRLFVRRNGIFSTLGPSILFERDVRGRITSVIDPKGNAIQYEYDSEGNLVGVTDREGFTTQFTYFQDPPHFLKQVIDPLDRPLRRNVYDEKGRLIQTIDVNDTSVMIEYDPDNFQKRLTDALGNTSVLEYDAFGNVVTIVNPLGGVLKRTVDSQGNITSFTDELGFTTSFAVDRNGNIQHRVDAAGSERFARYGFANNILSETDELGNTSVFTYDERGNPLSMTNPKGDRIEVIPDDTGNIRTITDTRGNISNITYTSEGRPSIIEDPFGNVTTINYDANGNMTRRGINIDTPQGPEDLVESMIYDNNDLLIERTDPDGNTTTFEYDVLGNLVLITDSHGRQFGQLFNGRGLVSQINYPDGSSRFFEYDALDQLISETDEFGTKFLFEYDTTGQVTAIVFPDDTPEDLSDNPRVQSEYNLRGDLIAEVDQFGNRTEFEYSPMRDTVLIKDPTGNENRWQYDPRGLVTEATDPLGRITQYEYDEIGSLSKTIFPDGAFSSSTLDAKTGIHLITDQRGNQTKFHYDDLFRVSSVEDAIGNRTSYTYDELGNLIEREDVNQQTTRYEFNNLGLPSATIRPSDEKTSVAYDDTGYINSRMDYNGDETSFETNEFGRVIQQNFPDGSFLRWELNSLGLPSSTVDSRGTIDYQYTEFGELASRIEPDNTNISYTYNGNGRLASITTPNGSIGYGYDDLNRLETVMDPDNGLTTYFYDAVNNLTRTDRPNGTSEIRGYNGLDRIVSITNIETATGDEISGIQYEHDAAGNVIEMIESDGRQVEYEYDVLNRLVRETITDAVNGNRETTFAYDAIGNRLARNDSIDGLTTYEYNQDNELTQEINGSQITTFTYDKNGNLLSEFTDIDNQINYEWDADNRLVAATITSGQEVHNIEYKYDAYGIRVARIVDGIETRYLVDVNREISNRSYGI